MEVKDIFGEVCAKSFDNILSEYKSIKHEKLQKIKEEQWIFIFD